MGFRFWRRIRILPGITLNLSKSGASVSFGVRGAHYTVGPRGRRATIGLPGTGLFYTATEPARSGRARRRAAAPQVAPGDRLTLGFFKRLVTPKGEERFVDGCRELALGDEERAFAHLQEAAGLADGAYLAGFLALKRERFEQSARFLEAAAAKHRQLGRHFRKYGSRPRWAFPSPRR